MPEGPEVRILVDQLNKVLKNKTLNEFVIKSGRYTKKLPDGYNKFVENLPLKIEEVKCKGKFIYFIMENNFYIFNTLGMTGGWKNKVSEKYDHIHFITNSITLYFNDYRNFGTFKFIDDKSKLDKKLKELGNDILSDEFTEEYCIKVFNKKINQNKTLPQVLMNQKLFCGLGNYLKSEVLYASKISPHRLVSDLNDEEKKQLFNNIKNIGMKSYKNGGASVRDFSDMDNEKGLYTSILKVYFNKTDPMGNKVIKETTKDKRTTHWVKEVQI